MAYVPVQRDEGRILYQSTMDRAKLMGDTLTNLGETLYKREEENKAFQAKNSALKQLILANKEQFGLDEATAKQFVSGDINKSAKENYLALASFLEGNVMAANLKKQEDELKTAQAQRALIFAQAQGAFAKANPQRTLMSMSELEARYPRDKFDYTGIKNVPNSPGIVDVTDMNISGRGPAAPMSPVVVSSEGGTIITPGTGERTIVEPITKAPTDYILRGNATAGQQAAPAATISPDVLAKFAPTGSMAPAAGGLLAQTGPQATSTVSPQTVDAIRAVQPPAAPARQTPATPSGLSMEVIPGSNTAKKMQAERQAEVSNYQLQMQNFDTVIDAVDRILPNVSAWSTGYGSLLKIVPKTKANQVAADLTTLTARAAFQGLEDIKNAGGSLGQVAIYEIKLLENARQALNQEGSPKDVADRLKNLKKITQDSKKRLEILARDRKAGLEVPSKEYFKAGGYWPGVSDETPTATNAQGGATGGGNVVRLSVQPGSTAGSSTLRPSEFDFSAFEGKVLNTPDGKRVRIVNGKEVPVVSTQ